MCNLNDSSDRIIFFALVMMLFSTVGLFFSLQVASVSPNAVVAVSLYPIGVFFPLAFAGYIIYLPALPDYLGVWAPYLSFLR
jgi:hypothetical protein